MSRSSSVPGTWERPRILWLAAAGIVLLIAALALRIQGNMEQTANLSADDPSLPLDQRMILIADQLQCPICEGQSVAYSNSQLAAEMRRIILDKLEAGEREEAIVQYFIDRYGVEILREPPRQGFLRWLWWTPPIALGLAALWLVTTLWRMARQGPRPEPAAQAALQGEEDILDPEVRDLLSQYDKDLFR